MKNRIFFLLAALTFAECKPAENTELSIEFVFGRFCGFCRGDCARVYKLQNGQLFADEMTENRPPTPLRFSQTALADNKRLLAQQLLDAMPTQLLAETTETIGCPDCADQCGYWVTHTQNGVTKKWFIDTFANSVPEYLRPFVRKMQETMTALQ
jgi:hypothetical protein